MPIASTTVATKRAYEEATDSDGVRILVDRLWPRGLTKDEAHIKAWFRDLAPSNELRKWFHSHPERWGEFRQRYLHELRSEPAAQAFDELYELLSSGGRVTLVFASKNVERNNATVLKEFLEGNTLAGKKPPNRTNRSHRTA
jgi:uncharacterized protein YeaO (DUF488 family)